MSQKIYAIVLQAANQEVEALVNAAYKKVFRYTDTFYLVAPAEDVTTRDIAEKVGIRGDGRVKTVSGVVFKLNGAYSGHTDPALWEWLDID